MLFLTGDAGPKVPDILDFFLGGTSDFAATLPPTGGCWADYVWDRGNESGTMLAEEVESESEYEQSDCEQDGNGQPVGEGPRYTQSLVLDVNQCVLNLLICAPQMPRRGLKRRNQGSGRACKFNRAPTWHGGASVQGS